jgi:uncharacterized protein YutD
MRVKFYILTKKKIRKKKKIRTKDLNESELSYIALMCTYVTLKRQRRKNEKKENVEKIYLKLSYNSCADGVPLFKEPFN